MISCSRNLAVSLMFMCFLVGVSGDNNPEILPSVPPDLSLAEIGHYSMDGLEANSADDLSSIQDSPLRSQWPKASRHFDEPRFLPPGGLRPARLHSAGKPPRVQSPRTTPPMVLKEEMSESMKKPKTEYHTSVFLFFLASMIVLPLSTIIVRCLKAANPELGFEIGAHIFFFVAICGLTYGCYDFESKGGPNGTMLTTTILLSRYGWTWCSLVVTSFLTGLAASTSHRFYKVLSFLSGFIGDFAFVLSCYIESIYHLTHHKNNSQETYLMITPLEDRDLIMIVVAYLLFNQLLEYSAQRFDLIHRGHEKYYDEDFEEESELESKLKVSVGCQTIRNSWGIPGWRAQRVELVYNRNKYRTPWTTSMIAVDATAPEATVIDIEETKPEAVGDGQYVAIDMDAPEEHQGQGDQQE